MTTRKIYTIYSCLCMGMLFTGCMSYRYYPENTPGTLEENTEVYQEVEPDIYNSDIVKNDASKRVVDMQDEHLFNFSDSQETQLFLNYLDL